MQGVVTSNKKRTASAAAPSPAGKRAKGTPKKGSVQVTDAEKAATVPVEDGAGSRPKLFLDALEMLISRQEQPASYPYTCSGQ